MSSTKRTPSPPEDTSPVTTAVPREATVRAFDLPIRFRRFLKDWNTLRATPSLNGAQRLADRYR